jgi:hypothetical protein
MTTAAPTISFKAPARILEGIPAPGNGRSRFIVRALEEKISRQQRAKWKPTTPRGRKFAALLEKGKKERGPQRSESAFEPELSERRGRNFSCLKNPAGRCFG